MVCGWVVSRAWEFTCGWAPILLLCVTCWCASAPRLGVALRLGVHLLRGVHVLLAAALRVRVDRLGVDFLLTCNVLLRDALLLGVAPILGFFRPLGVDVLLGVGPLLVVAHLLSVRRLAWGRPAADCRAGVCYDSARLWPSLSVITGAEGVQPPGRRHKRRSVGFGQYEPRSGCLAWRPRCGGARARGLGS